MTKYKEVPILEFCAMKNDTYRIREEVKLPSTKENIGSIILSRMGNTKLETRVGDGALLLHGEMELFCMYISDEWQVDYISQSVSFQGRIDCHQMEEGMFHYLQYNIQDLDVNVQMDEDGEMRVLHVEAMVNMNVDIYQEQLTSILEDAYVLNQNAELQKEPVYVESLVVQNQSKCKIVENVMVPELRDEVLQICTSSGEVQVEHVEVVENGISIEGIVSVDMLYVKEDDECPYASWQGVVPFAHIIECATEKEIIKSVDSHLEQVSISMTGNGEIEVKAVANFQSFIRRPQMIEVISQVELRDFTKGEILADTGIIGYIFKKDDDLWTLAKKYHTTVAGILNNNNINENDINIGQKLLIFKENVSIL